MFTSALSHRRIEKHSSVSGVIQPGRPVVDPFDGREYPTIEAGTQQWLAINVNRDSPAGWSPADSPHAVAGRVYTWAQADWIGDSFGDGWELPDDDDWELLLEVMGSLRGLSGMKMVGGHWRGWLGNMHCCPWQGIFWSATLWGSHYASAFPFSYSRAPTPFRGYRRNAYAVRLVRSA